MQVNRGLPVRTVIPRSPPRVRAHVTVGRPVGVRSDRRSWWWRRACRDPVMRPAPTRLARRQATDGLAQPTPPFAIVGSPADGAPARPRRALADRCFGAARCRSAHPPSARQPPHSGRYRDRAARPGCGRRVPGRADRHAGPDDCDRLPARDPLLEVVNQDLADGCSNSLAGIHGTIARAGRLYSRLVTAPALEPPTTRAPALCRRLSPCARPGAAFRRSPPAPARSRARRGRRSRRSRPRRRRSGGSAARAGGCWRCAPRRSARGTPSAHRAARSR